jgi:TetR/AcrR family transcriptional repressor of nem operon
MAKPSNRDKILTAGLQVVHAHGFAGASVRDIVAAAGVPQGSFTNHFASKEAFGLEILNMYFARSCVVIQETLRNEALRPLARLHEYIAANISHVSDDDMRNGCLIGNFSAEVADYSETIRERLVEIFGEVQAALTACLEAAVAAGELPAETECEDVGALIMSSLQGAILVAKAERSSVPVERFEKLLFSTILR